ncbi:hypothetical protein [Frondihabitans peucedani]|uniref:Uncharacterized protein n=1 Tax=Frondihabitans peucedani TaxID=598626 RepID=A0ABP8E195_9MICO
MYAEERQVRVGLLGAGATLLPIAGALLAALNLLQQTHGDNRLTLAILQNVSLTSLAFAVLFGLSTAISAGLAIGFASLTADRSMPPSVRRAASLGTTALLVVTLWTQTATVFCVAFAICYYFWRFPPKRFRDLDMQPSGVALEDWFNLAQPEDVVLRSIWQQGRAADGIGKEALREKIRSRAKAISDTRPAGIVSGAWVVVFAIFGTYGLTLLTTPVQLAPLESVTFKDHRSGIGYVFAGGSTDGIFVFRDMQSVRQLETGSIASEQLCWAPPSVFSRTLIHAFTREAQPKGRAVC